MLIDSHAHLDFKNLSINLKKIVFNANEKNISSILSINTKINEFQNLYNLIKNYKSIWCSIGEHPCNINNNNVPTIEKILKHTDNNKVIAIGETGLDFYHSTDFKSYQYESLLNHIEASYISNLPIIIHQRNSENELLEYLIKENKNKKLKVLMHCFTGNRDYLFKCLDNDFFISLGGIVTFKNSIDLQNLIPNITLSKLLVETDSPFLTPVPFRGKVNEPANVFYVMEFISSLLKIKFDNLANIINQNFYQLFTKAIKYEKIEYEN